MSVVQRLTCRSGLCIDRMHNAGDVTAIDMRESESRIVEELLHDDETIILLLRPSMLYVALSSMTSLAVIAVLVLSLAYASQFAWAGWSDSVAFGCGAGLMLLLLGWQGLEWYSRVYILTDRRIIRRMGVLRPIVFETSLRNIKYVSVFRRLRERLCGLGTIGFAAADSEHFQAFWVMIARPSEVHQIVVDAIKRYGRNG